MELLNPAVIEEEKNLSPGIYGAMWLSSSPNGINKNCLLKISIAKASSVRTLLSSSMVVTRMKSTTSYKDTNNPITNTNTTSPTTSLSTIHISNYPYNTQTPTSTTTY